MSLLEEPTAHTLLPEAEATPDNRLLEYGFGLGTRAHLVPFHCNMRVLSEAPLM